MSKYNKYPVVKAPGEYRVRKGWEDIGDRLSSIEKTNNKLVIVIDYYQGVLEEDVTSNLMKYLNPDYHFSSQEAMLSEEKIQQLVFPDVTDDRVFGYMSRLSIENFFEGVKLDELSEKIDQLHGTILITGPGAALLYPKYDVLVYADMARWEIQQRMRKKQVDNLGVRNRETKDWMLLYKQGFFVDWRVLDKWKKRLMDKWDFYLDTNNTDQPKMVEARAIFDGLEQCLKQPFSVVPFFDPGPWGGQWMKENCDLDPGEKNYAWCFNCVPEENSLLFEIGGEIIETPSINLIFVHPENLLGAGVHARFGDEFPIRFDFLDTMEGGNLSLQVHPLTEYIQDKFGMHYTQDESYYLMDVGKDAHVYLGLKEKVNPAKMIEDLKIAESGEQSFDAEKYIEKWPVNKHDHILIPAGTVHCSGTNSMVLEISATPYIFTFKLWDWGRLGLDGKPRPINVEHGKNNICWSRTTDWTKKELINQVSIIDQGKNWVEEKTGLHQREFIETRRHWFYGEVYHENDYGVNVLCLIEGDEISVECPENSFQPFRVHYAEVFIIPATIKSYVIKPIDQKPGKKYGTIKAFVRQNA